MKNYLEQLGQKLTEEDFNALMTALNQTALVSVTDAKGDITYANEKFVNVSKYSLEELIGENHRILKSGHQPDSMFVNLWKTISNGEIWRGEIKNKAKDGTYYWVDTSIAPIPGNDGKPERYIAVRFLINDKKAIENKMQEQVKSLEKLNKFMIGREIRMAELKERVNELEEILNNKEK